MTTLTQPAAPSKAVREDLVAALVQHSLVIEDVTLSSGARASYFIDAKRLVLQPAGFRLIREQLEHYIRKFNATAVGGLTLGADGIVFAAVAEASDDFKGFLVRKEPKPHGLQKLIEGPTLRETDRCLIVDDVVTSGASTVKAIHAVKATGAEICGVLAILDRLVGGREHIEAAAEAPFVALATIDDVYPDRPDK